MALSWTIFISRFNYLLPISTSPFWHLYFPRFKSAWVPYRFSPVYASSHWNISNSVLIDRVGGLYGETFALRLHFTDQGDSARSVRSKRRAMSSPTDRANSINKYFIWGSFRAYSWPCYNFLLVDKTVNFILIVVHILIISFWIMKVPLIFFVSIAHRASCFFSFTRRFLNGRVCLFKLAGYYFP